jgi:hypothetical protein
VWGEGGGGSRTVAATLATNAAGGLCACSPDGRQTHAHDRRRGGARLAAGLRLTVTPAAPAPRPSARSPGGRPAVDILGVVEVRYACDICIYRLRLLINNRRSPSRPAVRPLGVITAGSGGVLLGSLAREAALSVRSLSRGGVPRRVDPVPPSTATTPSSAAALATVAGGGDPRRWSCRSPPGV